MSYPTLIGFASTHYNSVSSVTLACPSGNAGDLLVAFSGDITADGTTSSSGWTTVNFGSWVYPKLYWKIATASSESIVCNFTSYAYAEQWTYVYRFRGTHPTAPISLTGKVNNSTVISPSAVIPYAESKILFSSGYAGDVTPAISNANLTNVTANSSGPYRTSDGDSGWTDSYQRSVMADIIGTPTFSSITGTHMNCFVVIRPAPSISNNNLFFGSNF